MLINTDKLKSIISAIKAYIKPPDYAQNDSTARDYIKNRPFYDAREAGGELKKIDSKYISAPDWSQNNPDGEGYVANRTHWREKVDELESTYDNLPVSINMLLWTTYDTQAITTMLGHYTTNNYLYNADWSNNPCPIMLYSVGGSSSVSTVLRMFISPLQNIKSVAVYNADGNLIGQATTDYTDIFKDKNGNTVTDNQGRTLYVGALVGTITLGSNSYDSGCTNYLYSIKIVQTDEYSYHPMDLNYLPDDIKYTAYNKSSATNLENGSGRYSLQQKSYGNQNNASGYGSFTIGVNATASGAESFASGQNSVASGTGSFASGGSKASAHYAHAEGCVTEASGRGAHSEGDTTTASGNYSHAEGLETTAQRKSQHAQGEYNVLDTTGSTTTRGTYAHIVGNGTSDSKRSNAHTLDWSGNAWFAGDVYTRSTSGTNKDAGSKKLATEELVNTAQSTADEAKLAAADANTKMGNLDNLKTDAKDNLVEAINEAAKSGGGAANAVLYTEQTLTDAEKAQARTNIGAGTGDGIDVSGAVGQIVKIKAVDDTGKPTEWEAVDMPSGGSETWELLTTYIVSTADVFEATFDAPVKKLMVVSKCVDTAGEVYSGSTKVYRTFLVKVDGSWEKLKDIKVGCCSHSWGYSGRIYIICEQDIALILKAEGLSAGTGTCAMGPVHPTGSYTNGNISGIKISLTLPDGTENTASGTFKIWGVKA